MKKRSGSRILTETWNGRGWTLQTSPGFGQARSVSCTSTTACTAVGDRVGGASRISTVAIRWNGTEWTTQSTTNPSSIYNFLLGVSCKSSTSCVAVGEWEDGTSQMFTEIWNGRAWTTSTPPNPAGATRSVLFGVSCVSASQCTAVGDYGESSGTTLTLAESWNGSTWTVQATPNPSGSTQSVLHGVACSSSTTCASAGTRFEGSLGALIERYH